MQGSNQPTGDSVLLKKLMYVSWHRGTREMDLILGRFSDKFLSGFSDSQLRIYERMLDHSDVEIFDWIRKQATTPKDFEFIVGRIRAFYEI